MSKFDQSKYITEYTKNNYTRCTLKLRDKENEILTKYSQNLNISKNALLQKCLIYCYENFIDVSNIKLSTPDKSDKKND